MKQAAYDQAVAARTPPAWPSVDEAKAYLTAKGYGEEGGKWILPWPDHVPTGKQTKCLAVLSAKAVAPPPKAHVMKADSGRIG